MNPIRLRQNLEIMDREITVFTKLYKDSSHKNPRFLVQNDEKWCVFETMYREIQRVRRPDPELMLKMVQSAGNHQDMPHQVHNFKSEAIPRLFA